MATSRATRLESVNHTAARIITGAPLAKREAVSFLIHFQWFLPDQLQTLTASTPSVPRCPRTNEGGRRGSWFDTANWRPFTPAAGMYLDP